MTTHVPDEGPTQPKPAPLSLAAWKHFVNVARPYWLGDE